MQPLEDPTPNPEKKTRVLLVDDDSTHQYSLRKHLIASGFAVAQAHTGEEAIVLAKQEQPDIVLLDIHLPDETGFDVCRRLKLDESTQSIPVVFHSATHDAQGARSSAMGVGAFAFLTYPIDIDHLVSVLRGAVARSSMQRNQA